MLEKLNWHHEGMRILHFAPEKIFYQLFASFKDIDYWPVDLNPSFAGIRQVVDMTNIPFKDDSFDLIMATHVLEHIPDDIKAMQEVYRVLKPQTGVAFLNVPVYKRLHTLENPEYNTPELRLKYYGHDDHKRLYGQDYPKRLESVGFTVQRLALSDISEEDFRKYGLSHEKVFYCKKE